MTMIAYNMMYVYAYVRVGEANEMKLHGNSVGLLYTNE